MSDADKVRYVGSTDKQAAMDDIRLEQAYGLTKGKKKVTLSILLLGCLQIRFKR